MAAGLQDVEWYARLMQVTRAYCIPTPLTLFRRHGIRIPTEVMLENTKYLLDRLWDRFSDGRQKRRYLLGRKVSFFSDLGKHKINQGKVSEGRADLALALRLAVREGVAGKMALCSWGRLMRSYARVAHRSVEGC